MRIRPAGPVPRNGAVAGPRAASGGVTWGVTCPKGMHGQRKWPRSLDPNPRTSARRRARLAGQARLLLSVRWAVERWNGWRVRAATIMDRSTARYFAEVRPRGCTVASAGTTGSSDLRPSRSVGKFSRA